MSNPPAPSQSILLDPAGINLQAYTATLDPQGDLTGLSEAAQPSHWGFKFSGYGQQQQPPKAPAGARDLPDSAYEFVNG